MPRQPILIAVTGMKGVGKTFRTFHFIWDYVQTTAEKVGRKVLVFDVNQEYNLEEIRKAGLNYEIPPITCDQIKEFSAQTYIEPRRVLPLTPDGKQMSIEQIAKALDIILEDFRTGMIIIDDINKFMLDFRFNQGLLGKMVSNRQRGQDIVLQYQSLAKLDTTVWQNLAMVRFHHQTDPIDRYSDRIPTYDIMKIAQLLVDDMYFNVDKRFYCYVDMHNHKISGKFDLERFKKAVRQYLLINKSELSSFLRMENLKPTDYHSGVEMMIKKKYLSYYGNSK
jgi:nucleoside-triphosphatase THEP1